MNITLTRRSIVQAVVFIFAGRLVAQPFYGFSQTNEPYQEIVSGVDLTFSGGFGAITALDGETFPVTGSPFLVGGARQLWVLDGGALNIDYAPVNTVFLSGLFAGFGGYVALDATSSVKYAITGPSGDRHLAVQWKNMHRVGTAAGLFVNFQIVMHQATGVLEVRYGPHDDGSTTYTPSTGPNSGFYFADYNATVLYERTWLTGNPASPVVSTALTPAFTGLSAIPENGTVYRFTPTWLTGLGDTREAPLKLFSAGLDPVSGAFEVVFNGTEAGTVTLCDLAGRVIFSTVRSGDRMRIGNAALPGAVYLIGYRTSQGERQVLRIAKS